jgi:acetyltransferase
METCAVDDHDKRLSTERLTTGTRPFGLVAAIRPLRWQDELQLLEFHRSLSVETVRSRYFGLLSVESRLKAEHLVEVCSGLHSREATLVAERRPLRAGELRIVGVARMIENRNAGDAELAVVIADHWQGQGLGTTLLSSMVELGWAKDLMRLFGFILPENYAMQHICQKLGFAMQYSESVDALEAEIYGTR